MYSTKVLNKNIAQSYLSTGDSYRDPHLIQGKNARFKGKQMTTVPAKDTCDGSGFFDKKTYTSDPLKDSTMYVKTQPIDQRKMGFGSKDAKRRDEFMSHVRTEQYRETLETELKILEKQKKSHEVSSNVEDAVSEQTEQERRFPEGLVETTFLYDIGRSQTTEFNQKSHRDRYYTMRTGNSTYKRNSGPYMLTSNDIGLGVDKFIGTRPSPKNASTKQFFDHSHLYVGST